MPEFNTTIDLCSCGNKNGSDHTDIKAVTTVKVWVRGNVGYALDALPIQYHGADFFRAYIGVCKRHYNTFVQGKALVVNHFLLEQEEKENTMTSKPINPKFAHVTYCTFCEANNGVCHIHPGPLDFEYQGDIIHVTEGTFDFEGNFVPKEDNMSVHIVCKDVIDADTPIPFKTCDEAYLGCYHHTDVPCAEFKPFVNEGVMYIHDDCVTCGLALASHPDADKYDEADSDPTADNVPCHNCKDGNFYMGPIVNGVPKAVFQCNCCAGKGYMTPEDVKRDNAYHEYHAAQAMKADLQLNEKEAQPKIKCGKCKGYHHTTNDVRDCFGAPRFERKPFVKSGDWFEKGRNVRKISNPYGK